MNKYNIPDVSGVPKVTHCYLAGSLTGTQVGMDKKIELLRKNFVRLIDKAIYEYQFAREAIIDELEEKNSIIHTIAIINHLENCINSIHRVFKLYDRIKKSPHAPKMDKILKKLAEVYEKPIRDMRHTLEHIDNEIQNDNIKDGQAVALKISKDYKSVEIAGCSMELLDITNILKHLYKIGLIIAKHKI